MKLFLLGIIFFSNAYSNDAFKIPTAQLQKTIFNGNPLPLEKLIPYRFNEHFSRKVLQAVMEDLTVR